MQKLQIVAFDVPFPPDYGGAVAVWSRLCALHKTGASITLHSYVYGKRKPAAEMAACSEVVLYYRRPRHWVYQFSRLPFIMSTRRSEQLAQNLQARQGPILFEGHHTAALSWHPALKGRTKVLLVHNVEEDYYAALAQSATHPLKKLYYRLESWKLKRITPKLLQHIDLVVAMTEHDARHYRQLHPRVVHIPVFHGENDPDPPVGRGTYALFHGNLGVEDNDRAARWLITMVWAGLDIPLVIAGKNPGPALQKLAHEHPAVHLEANPSEMQLSRRIQEAHLHLVVSFQTAGVKLKLLRALFKGRFCVANAAGASGSGLEGACRMAETPDDFRRVIAELMAVPFTEADRASRLAHLQPYNNRANAQKLLDAIFQPK